MEPNPAVKVRFAPSPTGAMHLGNVRAAIMNALFACQNNTAPLIRIEDTDASRNQKASVQGIYEDLEWLGLPYDTTHYAQSARIAIYQRYLQYLRNNNLIYPAFETEEELEAERETQKRHGMPPRYRGYSRSLSHEQAQEYMERGAPFVWRYKVPDTHITLDDMARGQLTQDLSDFADFPITRADGTFTFLFTNCVDDIEMGITHIIRGEDHLSNSARQAALYRSFGATPPTFYHLPLLCNTEGKKLSKRDFGSSLADLRTAGYLPEAVVNYLATCGGSYDPEIMTYEELVQAIAFDHTSPTGQITFDPTKLAWVNQQWIMRLSTKELGNRLFTYLQRYTSYTQVTQSDCYGLAHHVQSDITTLQDVTATLSFYLHDPDLPQKKLQEYDETAYQHVVQSCYEHLNNAPVSAEAFVAHIKKTTKKHGYKLGQIMPVIRIALTGKPQGLGVHALYELLGQNCVKRRLQMLLGND